MSNWNFEKLEIERIGYGENKGKFEGKIRLTNGDKGMVVFPLNEAQLQNLVTVIKPDMHSLLIDIAEGEAIKLRDYLL